MESGFPRSDSGEYLSAHDYPSKQERREISPDRGRQQESRNSGYRDESPNRRRRRGHTSRENSRDDVFSDEDDRRRNKEFRKSDLNKHEPNEYDDGRGNPRYSHPPSGSKFKRDGSRDELNNGRRQDDRGHTSDSSNFGFNREGSPNRPLNSKRHSSRSSREGKLDDPFRRSNSREGMLDDGNKRRSNSQEGMLKDGRFRRSNSREGMLDDRPVRRSNSREDILEEKSVQYPSNYNRPSHLSVAGNNAPDGRGNMRSPPNPQHASPRHMSSRDQGLPDLVPGGGKPNVHPEGKETSKKLHKYQRRTKSGYIGKLQDIDGFLGPVDQPDVNTETSRACQGAGVKQKCHIFGSSTKNIDDVLSPRQPNLMDTPVPKKPDPLKPHPNVPGNTLHAHVLWRQSIHT